MLTYIMPWLLFFAVLATSGTSYAASPRDQLTTESFRSSDRSRTYFLFVPDSAAAEAPLIVILHGSGMDGRSMLDEWKPIARAEGLILVGPNSLNARGWSFENDGQQVIHDLMESVRAKHGLDSKRIYLFGYSAGAVYALNLALEESQAFAAAAVYAGAIDLTDTGRVARAKRKIPIGLFVSTNDPFFSLSRVRSTRNLLKDSAFPVEMKEFTLDDSVHGHDYFSISRKVNRDAWRFLKAHRLASSNLP